MEEKPGGDHNHGRYPRPKPGSTVRLGRLGRLIKNNWRDNYGAIFGGRQVVRALAGRGEPLNGSEMGHIRSRIQVNSQFALVLRLLVVLGDPLAHFRRRKTNDGVLIGVVVRPAVKDIDAQQAFLQLIFVAVQRLFDDKTQ